MSSTCPPGSQAPSPSLVPAAHLLSPFPPRGCQQSPSTWGNQTVSLTPSLYKPPPALDSLPASCGRCAHALRPRSLPRSWFLPAPSAWICRQKPGDPSGLTGGRGHPEATWVPRSQARFQVLTLPSLSCVTWSNSLPLSEPQFPYV